MIDVVPESHRARAMSLLGGSYRVGVLIGPLIGAGLIAVSDLTSVFWLGAAMSVLASLLAATMPDLGEEKRAAARATGHLGVWTVIAAHRRVLATLGTRGRDPRDEPLAAAQPAAAVGRPRRAVGVHDVADLRRRRRPRRGVHVAGRLADGHPRPDGRRRAGGAVDGRRVPAAAARDRRGVGGPRDGAHRVRQRPRVGHRDDARCGRRTRRRQVAVPRRVAAVRRHRQHGRAAAGQRGGRRRPAGGRVRDASACSAWPAPAGSATGPGAWTWPVAAALSRR